MGGDGRVGGMGKWTWEVKLRGGTGIESGDMIRRIEVLNLTKEDPQINPPCEFSSIFLVSGFLNWLNATGTMFIDSYFSPGSHSKVEAR